MSCQYFIKCPEFSILCVYENKSSKQRCDGGVIVQRLWQDETPEIHNEVACAYGINYWWHYKQKFKNNHHM
jgi:hypothetical protein